MQKRILAVVFGTLLLDMIGTGMVFPIIPILFTDPSSPAFMLAGYSKGAQFLVAGLITSLFGLMQFIAAPILGELSDIYGRKKLLMLGVGILAISQLLFGVGIIIGSITVLLITRAIAGIAAANLSIAQATIADITEPKDRAKNFGLIGAAFGIGFILGPLLGGWIAALFQNAAAPFWFSSILGILNLLFVAFMLPETRKGIRETARKFHILKGIHNIRAALKDYDARPVYLTSFLYMSGFSFFVSFVGVLLVNRYGLTEAGIGTFFAFVGMCVVITQLFILRFLTKYYNEKQILRVSLLCVGGALFLYPFMPSITILYFLVPVLAIPQGLSMANIGSLVSRSVSAEKQGAALGINSSLVAFAQGVVPLVAGFGSGLIGIKAPFIAGSILVFSAWLNLFIFSKRP